jgi:hypothetical protein
MSRPVRPRLNQNHSVANGSGVGRFSLAHAEQPLLEVDVLPVEPAQLAAAQAGVGEEGEQEPVALACREKCRR